MAVIILGSGITPVIGTREFAPIPGGSSGVGGVTFAGGDVNNYVLTSNGIGDQIVGEPNLTFTGTILSLTGELIMPSGNITVSQMTPNATSSVLHYDPVSGRVTYGSSGGNIARYLRADGTWAIPPGAGITVTGAPLDNQITVWKGLDVVGSYTVEGTAALTFDDTTFTVDGAMTVTGEVDLTGMNPGVTEAVVTYNTFTGELTYSDSGGGTTNFLRADGAWATPAGGVSADPTPLNNQVAVWTNSTTIEGDTALTFVGGILTVNSTITTQRLNELNSGLGIRTPYDVHIGVDETPAATLQVTTAGGSNPVVLIWNALGSGYGLVINATSAATAQNTVVLDAGTDTIVRGLNISHITSGTAAAGLGTGISLTTEYDSGATQISAAIDTVITDPVYASGDADLSFKTNRANVLEESMLLESTGILQIDTINELTSSTGVTIEGVLIEDSDITIPTANYAYFNVGETAYIFDDSGDLTFEDDNIGPVTLTTLAATGASFGSDTQVPYTNVAGTDLLYTANLVYEDGTGAMEFKITTDDGSNSTEGLTVRNLDDGANPGRVNLLHERVTGQSAQADDLLGAIVGEFYNTNGSPAIEEGTVIEFKVTDVTDTAEETEINQYVMAAGSITQLTTLTSDGYEYLADHSAAQVANDRWLVDKGYVDTEIGAAGGLSASGTPVNDQVAVWTNASTLEGTANFTFVGTTLDVNNTLTVDVITEHTGSAGVTIETVVLEDGGITVPDLTGTGTRIVTASAAGLLAEDNLSGHISTTNSLVTAIGATAITDQSALAAFASGDSFLVYDTDAAALTEGTVSALQTYMEANLSMSGYAVIDGTPGDNRIGVWTSSTEIEGGTDLTWDGSTLDVSGDIAVPALGVIYLDGGGNTYILESAADTISLVAGANTIVAANATTVTFDGIIQPETTDVDDIGTNTYWWNDVYAQKYNVDVNTAYIDYSGTELQFTDGVSGTVALSTLVAGSNVWTKAGINLSPTTPGDHILLPAASEIHFDGGSNERIVGDSSEIAFFIDNSEMLTIESSTILVHDDLFPTGTKIVDLGDVNSFWARAYVDTLYIDDGNTYIDIDTGDMTFTDTNSGTVTLASLVAGGGTSSMAWTGSTANAVGTYGDADTIIAEANLTFDGTILNVGATGGYVGFTDEVDIRQGSSKRFYVDETYDTIRIGYNVGDDASTGIGNVFMGYNSGNSHTSGGGNAVIGYAAGTALTTGSSHTLLGYLAGYSLIGGLWNVAVGANALEQMENGSGNVAIGYYAMKEATAGNYSIAIGDKAGEDTTTGSQNIIIGYDVQLSSATASNELRIGYTSTILIGGNLSTGAVTLPNIAGAGTGTSIILYNRTTKELTYGDIPTGAGMVYPAAGIALSTGSGWNGTSVVNNSANWNTAYGWGDHGAQGYLDATHTSTYNHANYDTAYSWGDHSLAGYLTELAGITLSGDVTGTGTTSITTTIAADAVEYSMLNDNIISGQTDLASGLLSTDELLVSDAGTIKKMDVSVLETYMDNSLSLSLGSANQVPYMLSTTDLQYSANLTFSGSILDVNGSITVDTINEHTTNAGVTIEGVKLENNDITLPLTTGYLIFGDGSTFVTSLVDDELSFFTGSANQLKIATDWTTTYNDIIPAINRTTDLGNSSSAWFDGIWATQINLNDGSSNDLYYHIEISGTDMVFSDGSNSAVTLSTLAASGSGDVSWGTETGEQPIVFGANAGDIDSDSDLTWNTTTSTFTVAGNTYITGLSADDTELHLVAIDNSTGELTKRTVESIITAGNGITEAGGEVSLGGFLSSDVEFTSPSGVYGMEFGTSTYKLHRFWVNVNTEDVDLVAGNSAAWTARILIEGSDGIFMTWHGGDETDYKGIEIDGTAFLITDSEDSIGMEYAANYASGAGNRWIADKEYVDSVSDIRLKENILPIEGGVVSKLQKLQGYTFNLKEDESKTRKLGLIAQEVIEDFPEAVHEMDEGYLGIYYKDMVAVLVEAIKEQQVEIDKLKEHLNLK